MRGGANRLRLSQVVGGSGLVLVLLGFSLVGGFWPRDVQVDPSVTKEAPVTPMDLSTGVASNSPLFATDPNDSNVVALANRQDAPDLGCGLQLSIDGGSRWAVLDPVLELPSGSDLCYAPQVAFDGHGTLHYLFVGLAGAGRQPVGVYLMSSRDRGVTFSLPREVLGPHNFGVGMAVSDSPEGGSRMHLAWLHASSNPPSGGFSPEANPILSAYSDDGGLTFSPPVQVNDPQRLRAVAPALALEPDGDVHVAYYDLQEDARDYQGLAGPPWSETWSIVVASSPDRGVSFSPGVVVDDAIAPMERVMLVFTMPPPAIVVWGDGSCVAWTDARLGDADAMVSCTGEGRTWRPPARLNDDPAGNGSRQYLPRLSVAPGGRIDAVFYDRRDDLRNLGTKVFFASSRDGGRSFGSNLGLINEPFDPRIGQRYAGIAAEGQVEFGSRLGLVSGKTQVLAAWADTRNSEPNTTGQDVVVARIAVPTDGAEGRVKGGVLVALGSALMAWAIAASGRSRFGRGSASDQSNAPAPRAKRAHGAG